MTTGIVDRAWPSGSAMIQPSDLRDPRWTQPAKERVMSRVDEYLQHSKEAEAIPEFLAWLCRVYGWRGEFTKDRP